MPRKPYSPQDKEVLLSGAISGESLPELAAKLCRSEGGVAQEMDAMSKTDPDALNPETAAKYMRAWRVQCRKRYGDRYTRYALREEFPGIETYLKAILNTGYAIGTAQLTDSQLRMPIDEPPEDVDMGRMLNGFRDAMKELPHGINISLGCEEETLILSPGSRSKSDRSRQMRFLKALKYAFEEAHA